MRVIKSIYNFIVGDMIILLGILATLIVLLLINNVGAFTPLRGISGVLLVAAILAVLVATLSREARANRAASKR